MSYSIPAVIKWARATYDAAPDPRSMLAILDAMDATLTQLAEVRAIFGDDETLGQWDADANRLYMRLQAYYQQRNAMAAGEITGQYTMHVVAPVLHGQGYASPGSELWSKVQSPDVATPFTLANQLLARAEVMGIVDRLRDVLFDVPDYPDRLARGFAEKIMDGAEALGAAGAEGAADVLTERAERFVDKVKPQIGAEARAGVLPIVIGGGLAVLVLAMLLGGRR
jgi:hypothetical protein